MKGYKLDIMGTEGTSDNVKGELHAVITFIRPDGTGIRWRQEYTDRQKLAEDVLAATTILDAREREVREAALDDNGW